MSKLLVNGEEMDYSILPPHMRDGFRLYFEQGILPGSFGTAVLCNDLMGAIGKADSINIDRIKDYAVFLYNNAPGGSFGSREAVERWCISRQTVAEAEQ